MLPISFKKNKPLLIVLLFFYQSSFTQPVEARVKRIVFLGNSITWAGVYVNNVEAYLRAKYPDRIWDFINVGLSSETVSGLSEPGHASGQFPRPDLHERLSRVLSLTKPDLVFACYGMNDGIYMPFDESRFQKFKEGIIWLHDEVVKTGARIIHITPPYYDEARGKNAGYAAVLDRYSDWLLKNRKLNKWEVVDVHYPMKKYLYAHRTIDATFNLNGFALATDGVHPGEVGHWMIAREILKHLGLTEVAKSPGILESLKGNFDAVQYVKLVTERQNLLRDAWLSATKHQRPGIPAGLPLQVALDRSGELQKRIDSVLLK